MFGIFPLFALVIIAFNIVVFAGEFMFGIEDTATAFEQHVLSFPMVSGDQFHLTLGGVFIVASLFVLFVEILKATRSDHASTLNHAFSLGMFIICLIEFLIVKGFGNEYFLMISFMALIDVVAGYTVTISAARRDLAEAGPRFFRPGAVTVANSGGGKGAALHQQKHFNTKVLQHRCKMSFESRIGVKRLVPLAIAALVALGLLSAQAEESGADKPERRPSAEGTEVYFISPADGDTVSSPVLVRFGLRGMGIAPAGVEWENTGHHHLIINADLPALDDYIPADDNHVHFGGGQSEAEIELPPGTHTLQLLFADEFHLPHDPAIYSEPITITVE